MTVTFEPKLVELSAHDAAREMATDIAKGMDSRPKTIPSKYFYDARGGKLFGEITTLPEYYLTRAELALIEAHGSTILARSTPDEVFEVGSGSAAKICLLLDQTGGDAVSAYATVDVNGDALQHAAKEMQLQRPELDVTGYIGDFVCDLARVPRSGGRRLVAFFGSTIGNLDRDERAQFFADIASMLAPDDRFLLGLDLVKDRAVLHAAYNDSAGVTAEFTRNILRVVNRELDGDFPVDAFDHVPLWNEDDSRMEAWLRATRAMTVTLGAIPMSVTLGEGETMLTEVSCKFTRESVEQELGAQQLAVADWFTDADNTFALALISGVSARSST